MSLRTPEKTEPGAPSAAAVLRPRNSRLRALDGLRLLAAMMVCVYHYAGRGGEVTRAWHGQVQHVFPNLSPLASYGCLGVQVFFVISGFVICMSSWGRTVGDFFRSRVSRLYPAYWVAIVMVAVACLALPAVSKPLPLEQFLVNLTMLQQPIGVPRVIGVDWTLWTEARFYILFALFVIWRGTTYRRVVVFCCLWTIATALAGVAHNPLADQITMPDTAPFFIGGLALYLIHRYGSDLLLWGIVATSWLLGQHYATIALWHAGETGFPHRSPYVVLLIVTFAFASVAAVALGWLHWANWNWLTFAGALTYPFYLIHEHLGWFSITLLHHKYGLDARVTLVAAIAAMLVLAWLMHRFVEKPFSPWLRRAMKLQAARLLTP